MAQLNTSSQLGSGTGTNNNYAGTGGATKLWAGGSTTAQVAEDFEVASGVTITGNSEGIIAGRLVGPGSVDFTNELNLYFGTTANSTGNLNLSVPVFNIHYANTTYKAFGSWNITNGAAGSTFTTDARPEWNFTEFNGLGPVVDGLAGLSFFGSTLRPSSSLGVVNLWNGETGDNALGCHLQAGSILPFDSAVLPPAGANLNNLGADDYRNWFRIVGAGPRNGANENLNQDNHLGAFANIDYRALGLVAGDASDVWLMTLEIGANAVMINPLPGRPQTFATFGVNYQFGGSDSRLRFLVASNPQTDAVGDHRYTFQQTTIDSGANQRGLYVPADAVWDTDRPDTAYSNNLETDRVVDNPANGFFIRAQEIITSGTNNQNLFSISAGAQDINDLPTDLSFRKYSLSEQRTNDEFGQLYTIMCPTDNAPDTIAEEADGDVSLERARANGYNVYHPTTGWQNGYDVSSTADDAFLEAIPDGTFATADAAYGIVGSTTANANRTVSDIAAMLKAFVYSVDAGSANAANDKVDLPYSYDNGVLNVGNLDILLSDSAVQVQRAGTTWVVPCADLNTDGVLNTILTTGTITGSRNGNATIFDQNAPGPGDISLTLPTRADTYFAIWDGSTITNSGLCNGQTLTTSVGLGNSLQYAIVSKDLVDFRESVAAASDGVVNHTAGIGNTNPFFDSTVVFDGSEDAYSYITPYDGAPTVSPAIATDPNDGSSLSVEFYSIANTAERRINVARWSNICLSIKSGTSFGARYAQLLARNGGTPIIVSGSNPGELSDLINIAYTNPTQIEAGAATIEGSQGGLTVSVSALPTSFSEIVNYDIIEGRVGAALESNDIAKVTDIEPLY